MTRISRVFFSLITLFLLIFPKGGFKIGKIPITWGYLLLGFTTLLLLLKTKFTVKRKNLTAFCLLLPFQILCLITLSLWGIHEVFTTLSFFTGFYIIPFIFLIFFSNYIETIDCNFFCKLLRRGIFFISLYGIFLFFFKIFTGFFLEIPFLTVNFSDWGSIANKNIFRGWGYKLISTYTNGNLYGISLLMLYPLYEGVEKSGWKKGVVATSLILTFSRTVWVGFMFLKIAQMIFIYRKPKELLYQASLASFILLLLISLFHSWNIPFSFFFDPTLGGRVEHLNALTTSNLFGDHPFIVGIAETTYLLILDHFGWVGLFTFFLFLLAGVISYFLYNRKRSTAIEKSILLGIATYLFVAISDGAILLIPVMPFYWFLNAFLLRFTEFIQK